MNTTCKCPFSSDVLRAEKKKAAVKTKKGSDDQPGATDENEQKLLVRVFLFYFFYSGFKICQFYILKGNTKNPCEAGGSNRSAHVYNYRIT